MKHLEDEDIGRLIDGNVNPEERKSLLLHLSQCNDCLKIYTETLSFIEDEARANSEDETPIIDDNLSNISIHNNNASNTTPLHTYANPSKKRFLLAIAASILLLIGVAIPIMIKWFARAPLSPTEIAQMKYIENTIEIIENSEIHAFTSSNDKTFATIRSAILLEDLSALLNLRNKNMNLNVQLKTKLVRLVTAQLKTIAPDSHPLFKELENISDSNARSTIEKIQLVIKQRGLLELFDFGQFIESNILSSFKENNTLSAHVMGSIEKFKGMAEKKGLPEGVVKELNNLNSSLNSIEIRESLTNIKEIFVPTDSDSGDNHGTTNL